MTKHRLLFLASGRGSCFEAVNRAISKSEIPNAEIIGLITNRNDAPVLEIAKTWDVPTQKVPSQNYRKAGKWDRGAYEVELLAAIRKFAPDFICLGGYLLVLGEAIVREFPERIINIHPSLLPAFPGLRAQKQALNRGVRFTGCTVHLVNQGVDEGPIVDQSWIEVLASDDEVSLSARLLPLEHQTYVRSLERLCREKFEIRDQKIVWLG